MAKNDQTTTQDVDGQKEAVQKAPAAAAAASKKPANIADYHTIEELKALRGTPTPIFDGVCVYQDWRSGKMVTEAEYDQAVKEFSAAPMGRRKPT